MTTHASKEQVADDGASKSTELFELVVTIMLGLAAVLSAWASHQGGLWGGNSATDYADAGRLTTEASTEYQEVGAEVIRDSSLDIQAKRSIIEGAAEKNEDLRDAKLDIARYLYVRQLGDAAYAELKLPPALRESGNFNDLSDDDLIKVVDIDLSGEYWDKQLAGPEKLFHDADAKFESGRKANGTGDAFNYTTVLFTVALFFFGISLALRSKVRWGLVGLGAVVLGYAAMLMFALPSAGGAPAEEASPAGSAAPEPTGTSDADG